MGRPSSYTDEIATAICDRLISGESLLRICSGDDMPGRRTVSRWVEENETFRHMYARAKDLQADALFDQIAEIAHDGSKDFIMSKFGPILDAEHVQRSRLRVDTLKFQIARLAPKKYAERQIVQGDDDAPIAVRVIRGDL